MIVPIILKKEFWDSSIWGSEIRSGIEIELKRKKYDSAYFYDGEYRSAELEAVFDKDQPRLVIIIGTSISWIHDVLDHFAKRGIDVLLVSNQPPANVPLRGVIRLDYFAGVDLLIRHFKACGCRSTALYGCFPDSSTDKLKLGAFREYSTPQNAVFENSSGLENCYRSFRLRLEEFDSLLCVNDIAAASLINYLKADGIAIPERLQIACFGGSGICRMYRPSITSITMSQEEIGRQAISAYSYIARSGERVNISIRVTGKLECRDSTRLLDPEVKFSETITSRVAKRSDYFNDRDVTDFSRLDRLLNSCDESDLTIIKRFLAGKPTSAIAAELSFSPENIRYRLRRMTAAMGLTSQDELLACLKSNRFSAVFDG